MVCVVGGHQRTQLPDTNTDQHERYQIRSSKLPKEKKLDELAFHWVLHYIANIIVSGVRNR